MIDVSNVDIRAFYSCYVKIDDRKPVHNRRTEEDEYHGSCPWCGGTNRFMFTLPRGRYSCAIRSSGCGKSGRDVIDFLCDKEEMSLQEACEELEIELDADYIPSKKKERVYNNPHLFPPCETWRNRGEWLIDHAEYFLHEKPYGGKVDEELQRRGLIDATIREWRLGYVPLLNGKWLKEYRENWGIPIEDGEDTFKIPSGILIPWFVDGVLWSLQVRLLMEDGPKYLFIKDSGRTLFHLDAVTSDTPVCLVESALDVIAGQQCCKDIVFVATGSAGYRPENFSPQVLARLCIAPCILVAFDDDPLKDGVRAGDRGAQSWLDVLPHAIRWMPWSHDVNDMLIEGKDITAWVQQGLQIASLRFTHHEEPDIQQPPEPQDCCEDCGTCIPLDERSEEEVDSFALDFYYTVDDAGYLHWYCSACRDEQCIPRSQPEPEPLSREEIILQSRVVKAIVEQFGPMKEVEVLGERASNYVARRKREIALQRIYCPVSLPRLPRLRCANRQCTEKALAHGWCAAHALSHDLLCLGTALDYPEFKVNQYRSIADGIVNWEAYAECAPGRWLQEDIKRIRRKFDYEEPLNLSLPIPAKNANQPAWNVR